MIECYGGIDLGGSFIKAGLLTSIGETLEKIIVPSRVDAGIAALKENLNQIGHKLIEISEKHQIKLSGIGIGSPGTIQFPEGIVTGATPNIPGWIGTNISAIFGDFKCPIAADNDANCMGLAEALFGSGKGTKNGFYLTLGTGIGGSIIINDQLMRGASYCAGEFGHTILKYGGAKCKTGRRGCLEYYVAAPALVRAAKKYASKDRKSKLSIKGVTIEPKTIFASFNSGDSAASKAVEENAAMLGAAIGSVVNLLNPEVVVIGGGLSLGGKKYINLVRKHVFEFAFESTTSRLKIETAKFGNEAGWIGAACLNIPRKEP